MGLFDWIAGGVKDFLGGMLSEFLDWLVEVVVAIADRLGGLFEQILSVFNFVPQTARYFDKLLRAVLFFAPDIVFNILYSALALVGILLICKLVLRLFGK